MNIVKNFLHTVQNLSITSKVCKTRRIDDRFFECRVKKPNPNYCEHSLCSGDGFICNHQDLEIFAQK